MSTTATERSDGSAPGGTVFDIGYQRYTGVREGRGRARLAIYKDGVRTALGFGRGARAKVLPWLFLGLLSSIGLIMAMIAGAAERLGGPGAAEKMNLPSHVDFYGIASVILFVFAALVGPELLCPDRRQNTITLYLVRPLTGSDYIWSRWSAFLTVMLIAAWTPQFILFLGLAAGDPQPTTYLLKHWLDVPKFLLAGLAISAYATTLALLTASFTNRRAYAAVFLVGVFVITAPFTVGMAEEIGGKVGQWISLFNLANIPLYLNDVIFGELSDLTQDAPANKFPKPALVGWYFLWTLVPGVILWSRYRRMSP